MTPLSCKAQRRKWSPRCATLPILRDARINGDMQRPEIVIRPHLDLAAQLGVTVSSISQTIRIATLGDLDENSAKFSLSDRQVPIRVSLIEDTRRDSDNPGEPAGADRYRRHRPLEVSGRHHLRRRPHPGAAL